MRFLNLRKLTAIPCLQNPTAIDGPVCTSNRLGARYSSSLTNSMQPRDVDVLVASAATILARLDISAAPVPCSALITLFRVLVESGDATTHSLSNHVDVCSREIECSTDTPCRVTRVRVAAGWYMSVTALAPVTCGDLR